MEIQPQPSLFIYYFVFYPISVIYIMCTYDGPIGSISCPYIEGFLLIIITFYNLNIMCKFKIQNFKRRKKLNKVHILNRKKQKTYSVTLLNQE